MACRRNRTYPVELTMQYLCMHFHLTGVITRNSLYELSLDNIQRHKICDAIAVASIVTNCAGVESIQNRCLGLKEFKEFLEDYQDQHLHDEEIVHLIQVFKFNREDLFESCTAHLKQNKYIYIFFCKC
jgi:predicted house-cleaning noncanonical NTP pyrophosphatase (MazG superfamily)